MTTRLHVLHLIDGLAVGGAEVLLRETAAGLLRRGYQVTVGYSTPGPLVADLEKLGLKPVQLSRMARIDPTLLVGMVKLIRSEQPHVVHTHLFKSDFHGRLAARLAGAPVVVSTLHNADIWARRWPLGMLYGATGRYFADKVIACSDEVREYHLKHTGLPAEKTLTIENGVDLAPFQGREQDGLRIRSEFGFAHDAPVFGIIGRFKPQKDHATFLQAAAQVLRQVPSARFLVVGDGPLRPELEEQARSLGLFPALVFAGLRSDIPAIMAAFDVLVFSSRWEGLPVTLLEGMAASRAVVATAVDGIRGVAVPEQTALLVPPGNPDALAQACISLAYQPDVRQAMGQAGLERVRQRYSLEAMIERTLGLYHQLLQARGLGHLLSVGTHS